MNRKILAALTLLIAEGLIITVMLLLPGEIPTEVRILDMVVLSIILWVFGFDFFSPLVNLEEKHPTQVGSMGVRWTGQILYLILAVGFAIICTKHATEIAFHWQLIGQIALLGMLLMFYFLSASSSHMIKKVGEKEDQMIAGRQEMRTAVRQLLDEIAVSDNLPEYFKQNINDMDEKLRYIAPNNSAEAVAYEKQFADIASRVLIAMNNFSMNEDAIQKDLKRMQVIITNRKNIHN